MAVYRELLCTLCALLAAFGLSAGQTDRTGCTDTRQAYGDKGFSLNDVPQSSITSDELRVCPTGNTCCTVNMESVLTQTSSAEFENIVYDKSNMLRDYFYRRTERFDNFMNELITNSQADFHDTFSQIYGQLFEQYQHIFDDLFTDFRNYYYGRDIDLGEVMSDFFNQLFERMFQLLNAQYVYTDEFWSCTRQDVIMQGLKPFGDIPHTLSDRAKKSFVAARTFGQGLAFGRDAVTRGTKVEPTPECRKALMRMSYCPHCKGIPYVKPCYPLCVNIMKGCLASQAEMEAEWNYYIDAMSALGERMIHIQNIEIFLGTIDIYISEAIMAMQDNALSISNKVFNGCGVPSRFRNRRETETDSAAAPPPTNGLDAGNPEDLRIEDDEMVVEEEEETAGAAGAEGATDMEVVKKAMVEAALKKANRTGGPDEAGLDGRQGRRREGRARVNGQSAVAPTSTVNGGHLDRLTREVLKRLADSRPFWYVLPYMVCDTVAEDVAVEENCWNGEGVGRYVHDLMGNGAANQKNNPEVEVTSKRPVAAIRIQRERLERITDILQQAKNGNDVPFYDNEEESSGSGSGSGSGAGPNDNVDDMFTFSTVFDDPIYRPTRPPADGGAPSSNHRASLLSALLTCLVVLANLRW